MFGVCLMLGEALLAVWGMARQRRNLPRTPITYLLCAPRCRASARLPGGWAGRSTPSGDQFSARIQQALPHGTRSDRYAGTAPWVAFTLTGLPDRPIELGMVVADRRSQRRAETANAVRAIIQGQLLGAQLDEAPDPLASAHAPGVTVAWREYGLKLPAALPAALRR